jgi:threonine dehydrogenase-like Zn-dependent dehydrogenase
VLRVQGVKELVVQDVSPDRLALGQSHAGLRVALGKGLSLNPALAELGGEPQAIIEATGVPGLVPAALAAVRHRGVVVLLGSSRGSAEIDLYKLIHRKGATLVGAHEWMLPNRAPPGVPSRQGLLNSAVAWLQSGEIQVDGLVTDRVRPDALPATYERLSADKTALGIVVDWD